MPNICKDCGTISRSKFSSRHCGMCPACRTKPEHADEVEAAHKRDLIASRERKERRKAIDAEKKATAAAVTPQTVSQRQKVCQWIALHGPIRRGQTPAEFAPLATRWHEIIDCDLFDLEHGELSLSWRGWRLVKDKAEPNASEWEYGGRRGEPAVVARGIALREFRRDCRNAHLAN